MREEKIPWLVCFMVMLHGAAQRYAPGDINMEHLAKMADKANDEIKKREVFKE